MGSIAAYEARVVIARHRLMEGFIDQRQHPKRNGPADDTNA